MNISVLTDPGVGGTFVSWSLYFLSGQDHYWYYRTNSQQLLPHDPLSAVNSHQFMANQFNNSKDLELFKQVSSSNKPGPIVSYMHPWGPAYSVEQTKQALNYLAQHADRCVTVTVPQDHYFYHCKYQGRVLCSKLTQPTEVSLSWQEQHADFVSYFFADAQAQWQQMGLTQIWDQREFLALNLRPYHDRVQLSTLLQQSNAYHMDARDVWFMLDSAVVDLMNWLGLPLVASRLQHWQLVYQTWRKYHHNRVRFFWYFDSIIEAILNNHSMSLDRFDLDLVQESVIQHELIYRHGLNFKTFQLEKFHSTQQLHALLEPNIHPVEPIYNQPNTLTTIQNNSNI
jgi:hypothetical protein